MNLIIIFSMGLVMISSPAVAADNRDGRLQSAPASTVVQEGSSAKIEVGLVDQFSTGAADYIVRFTDEADLSAANQMGSEERGWYVYSELRKMAERSQRQAKQNLRVVGLGYQTFIAGNELYVWGGNLDSALSLASLPEVESIRQTRVYHIDPVTQGDRLVNDTDELRCQGPIYCEF